MATLAAGVCVPLLTSGVGKAALVATGVTTAATVGGNVLTNLLKDGVDHLKDHGHSQEELEDWLGIQFQQILDAGGQQAAILFGRAERVPHADADARPAA